MKITNKCAGEWRLFSEELPPEDENIQLACARENSGLISYYFWSDKFWFSEDEARHTVPYASEDRKRFYDAYCVIRGPWGKG